MRRIPGATLSTASVIGTTSIAVMTIYRRGTTATGHAALSARRNEMAAIGVMTGAMMPTPTAAMMRTTIRLVVVSDRMRRTRRRTMLTPVT